MSRVRLSPAHLLLAGLIAAPISLLALPEPTPTPSARLTGGFGKAPAGRAPARGVEKGPVRLTNQSLVTDPDKGKVSTSTAPTALPTTPGARRTTTPAGVPTAPTAPTAPADTGQGEAYWRGEAQRLRERVAELRDAITRLEADTKRLEADYYAWDDGAYRDKVIKPAWDKAREELATARLALPAAEKDLVDLPDRARRAGALPGWLRE
jgi:hypothetical protein